MTRCRGPTAVRRIGPLLAVAVVGVCLLASAPTALGAIYPWTGTWETEYGTMQLTQTESKVTGKYGYGGSERGKIEGKVSGATLTGTWDALQTGGPTEFGSIDWTMNADGMTFAGTWMRSGTTEGGGWNGTRTSPLPPPIQNPPPPSPEDTLDTDVEKPSSGPDSALARLIRRFQDQVERDLKLPLYRERGRALWTHGDNFQAALRSIKPRNAAESRAKACALDAGFHWEYHGRQLYNVYVTVKRHQPGKVPRYKQAAAAHLVKANRNLNCALANLPARPDPDPPPTRPKGDSATIIAFHALDPDTQFRADDVVLPGRTMTHCFGSNTVNMVISLDLADGSVLTATWTLPNGRTTSSQPARGPVAGTMVASVFYAGGAPLPTGVYTYEARTQRGVLARASFTRTCS
jgi:hypothetical protein